MRKSSENAAGNLDPFSAPSTDLVSRGRAQIMGLLLVLPFMLLIGRLWYLQIAHGEEFLLAAQSNRTRVMRVEAPRGLIVDSTGALLASNKPQFAVYAVPAVAERKDVLARLASILNESPADLAATLRTEQHNKYSPVRLGLNLPLSTLTQIEEERPYMPGVSTAPEPVRWYPCGDLLANVIGTLGRIDPAAYKIKRGMGYFSDDFVGKSGLERQYEELLHGAPGGTMVEMRPRSAPVAVAQVEPIPGKTIHLTINPSVQQAAEDTFHSYGWTGGAVAVDPNSGAILAMASAPTYNPNAFAEGIDARAWQTLLMNPEKPMLDRAVDSLYPPGSTFKQVVALAGLRSHAVTPNSSCYCTGSIVVDKQRFGCWAVHGETDLYKAIADSCDIYFYKMGLAIGPERLSAIAREYPLARSTGIDLPREMIGSIPSPAWKRKHFGKFGVAASTWYDGDTLNMAIGQGYVLTTPLQMALVTAATANGGTVFQPYLMSYAEDPITGAVIQKHAGTVISHVRAQQEDFDVVRKGMRECVTDGTGKIVDFKTVKVAAKTGSAQVTGRRPTHGWFVAFAPYDHPTIAIAAIVEHGGHGADSAGKVVRAMLKSYFKVSSSDAGETAPSD